jgi:wyosine [tRNA(Phe)-imidazoG37] synthetase (radical SAM superfamily)
MLTFGPVPSRRLGRSLGINNIPPKACSYSCIYCQVGPTRATEIVPREFYPPAEILAAVRQHVARVRAQGEAIDYLTLVPDGEPTLDSRLGATIEALRVLDIPIAVISNASLIWREDVRCNLAAADWVSLKLDAVDDTLWRQINRPHPDLDHAAILDGMLAFARDYRGTLATETMLVQGVNDSAAAARRLADFLDRLAPAVAYLAVPIRPPAESLVRAADEAAVTRAYQIVSARLPRAELLIGYEGNAFASTGDLEQDLLSITAVHPMREEAVRQLLADHGADWQLVERLTGEGRLLWTEFDGRRFLVRRLGAAAGGA